jgi:DNA modification methylase
LIKILQGNCINKIKELDDNSINCVVSSPPYFGLRDYQVDEQFGLEKTYQEYIANTVKVFETFKPKLKDTATIWWNVGDSYSSGSRKTQTNQTVRKYKLSDIKNSKEKYLAGFKVRPAIQVGIKEKDLLMIPNRVAIALQDAGWYIRSEIIWHKPNPMPESVRDRPTSCHEKIWLITKNKKYYYDADAIKEDAAWDRWGKQTHKKDKVGKAKLTKDRTKEEIQKLGNGKRNKRNVWTITTKPFKDAHFATFPKDLIEPCIKAGCPEGGIVLDPFGGSGTTGIVAQSLNRQAILIELNKDYINIANKRIDKELGMFSG